MDCDTAGTRTVRSFVTDEHPFFQSTYVDLRSAYGCAAVYTRVPGKQAQHGAQVRRYVNGTFMDYYSSDMIGNSAVSPMYSVEAGSQYGPCITYSGRSEFVCGARWP